MSAPPNASFLSTMSRANMGNVAGAVGLAPALVGEQQIRNAPPAVAAAVPAAAQVAPQQQYQQQQPQQPRQPQSQPIWLYDTPQKLQAYLDSHNPSSNLYLDAQMDVLLANTRFDCSLFKDINFPQVKYLGLNGIKNLVSLQYFNFPDSLTELVVRYTGIYSLIGVKFPPNLIRLRLDDNKINSLDGVKFPFSLQKLDLTNNKIQSLNGVTFPPNLTYLQLGNNNIASLWGVHFPPNLIRLTLWGNPISSLKGILDPSPNIIQLLGEVFPMLREKSALKAARQSQKADLKFISDSTQHSMQNQLKAVTAFLREGMKDRAQQHADQLAKEVEERGRAIFFVRGGPNGKIFTVPLNTSITIQEVIDYLNDHYYISVLDNCGVVRLVFSGTQLEPGRTLADYNVLAGSSLHIVCAASTPTQGGSKKRPKKSKKRRNKSTKKWT